MRFDKNKAFPYPVLRPESDDFSESDFQAAIDCTILNGKIEISVSYSISSEEIKNEIKNGSAQYVSIISCRDTYFRKVLASKDSMVKVDFDVSALRGEVKVEPYIFARKDIIGFFSDEINSEFGAGPFDYTVGDIFAQDEAHSIFIERELFKPVTSVFDLVKKDGLPDYEWAIDFSENHVKIEVSPLMKGVIDDARNNASNKSILINSIYFSAVMQAVQKLKDSAIDYEDRKWKTVMELQAHNKGIDIVNEDAYLVAERLMHHPMFLLHAHIFKGRA